jgi:glycosyltransferase involved in cell wall biosynthesis
VDEDNRNYLIRAVASAVAHSDHIITISQNSRREILEHYGHNGLDPGRITVALPATDPNLFYPRPVDEISDASERYGIDGPFVLFTGTLEPRKNLHGVLNTWKALPKAITEEYRLVLTGQKGWLDQDLLSAIDAVRDTGTTIIQTGYVPEEDLPKLYSGAAVFLYPSHYEGFGMPPLEAMACGAPVVTSNNSALPEVVGDAGLMADADDAKALAAAVEGILTDSGRAGALREQGLNRARQFSWDTSAKAVLEVLEGLGR